MNNNNNGGSIFDQKQLVSNNDLAQWVVDNNRTVSNTGSSWLDNIMNKGINNDFNAYKNAQNRQINLDNRYATGLSRGQQLWQELGQGQFQNMFDTRSDAQKEILDRRRDLSRGLSAQENAAARANFEGALRRSGATARTNLAQQLSGRGMAGGGYGASQRAGLESQLGDQQMAAERQLLLDNVAARNQGLANYETTLGNQEAGAWDRVLNQYNAAVSGGQQQIDMWNAEENRKNELAKAKASKKKFLGLF